MVPKPAQYLLRFDDLCPTMARGSWERFLPLMEQHGIRPILAVVPDNQDRDLKRREPDAGFWDEMRRLEAGGATIALHGYRHLCSSMGRSMVPLDRHSEFAGLPAATQREWIRAGLRILRDRGLNPRVWVAPRHGFDWNTLEALRGEGIQVLSDGLARGPVLRGGVTWVPQQLWAPVEKSSGLWTICVHPNSARALLLDQLGEFVHRHATQFTSIDRVLVELDPPRLSAIERMHEAVAWWRLRTSRHWRRGHGVV